MADLQDIYQAALIISIPMILGLLCIFGLAMLVLNHHQAAVTEFYQPGSRRQSTYRTLEDEYAADDDRRGRARVRVITVMEPGGWPNGDAVEGRRAATDGEREALLPRSPPSIRGRPGPTGNVEGHEREGNEGEEIRSTSERHGRQGLQGGDKESTRGNAASYESVGSWVSDQRERRGSRANRS